MPLSETVKVSSESMDHQLSCLSQPHSESKSWNPFSCSDSNDSKILISESLSEEVVMLLKFTLSDKPSPRVSLPTTKSSLTRHKKDKSRSCFFSMTGLCWSLTQEDANPKSTVVQVPELDTKNLTDDWSFINIFITIFIIFITSTSLVISDQFMFGIYFQNAVWKIN